MQRPARIELSEALDGKGRSSLGVCLLTLPGDAPNTDRRLCSVCTSNVGIS